MKYLSVCSGIEAATVAWHPIGFVPVAFSEIEPFPCKVLAHHYPSVPNLGDMTKFKEWPDANVDILVGGTPCQSFSIAGLRKGLDDPRGNLMLTYLAIAARNKPQWVVWENVPGVLSSNGGKDFGTFLGGLGQLGYGFAYRVLDAQYVRTDGYPNAVPQRRRRVFVVGHIGDWRRAAAVLFDSESMRGNLAPSRKARESVAGTISKCSFTGGAGGRPEGAAANRFIPSVAKCLTKGQSQRYDSETETMLPVIALAGNTIGRKPENGGNGTGFDDTGSSYTLTKTDVHAVCLPINTQIATRHEAMGEGTGLGIGEDGQAAYTLQAAHSHAVAFSVKDDGRGAGEISPTLCNQHTGIGVAQNMQVRRLTPRECERLQGFEDGYTDIPGASDTTRYKSLGNSMAVNVMQIIGEQIKMVESIKPMELKA